MHANIYRNVNKTGPYLVGTYDALIYGMNNGSQATGRPASVGGNQPGTTGADMATKKNARVTEKVDNGTEPVIPENKNVGRYFGERVVGGQNSLFEANREMRLTDEQLALLWNAEWPNSACTYRAFHVKGARRDYNRGKHGNPKRPTSPVPQFVVNGEGEVVERS